MSVSFRLLLTFFVINIFLHSSIFAENYSEFEQAFNNKNYPIAEAKLLTLLEKDESNANIYYQLAKTNMGLKNYRKAVEYAGIAVRKDPTVSDHHRLLSDTQVLLYVGTQTTSLFKLPGIAKRVKRGYITAINLDPTNIEAQQSLGMYYLMVPGLLGGSIKKASQQADIIASTYPNKAYTLKIGVAKKRKQWKQVETLIQQWQQVEPDKWPAREAEFRYHNDRKNYSAAANVALSWLEKYPNEMNANYLLGVLAAESGEFLEEGRIALEAYNNSTPDMNQAGHEWSHYRLAQIYAFLGQKNQALETALKAENLQPQNEKVVSQVRKLINKYRKHRKA